MLDWKHMHIYFSGIGGTAIGPLSLIAHQAGFKVSGSDKQNSAYIEYLHKHGIDKIHIGQTYENIAKIHESSPIDWFVYSSAVSLENPKSDELRFCNEQGIKISKRDELINLLLDEKKLKLIAIAGTHGKSTTTAMVIWLFKQLDISISYSVGAKLSFGEMGEYQKDSKHFVYEADEFDRNFLAFKPYLSIITGVSWDHHEIFPTRASYKAAFREFITQSDQTILWQEDFDYLQLETPANLLVQQSDNPLVEILTLKGHFNRLDAWLAISAVHRITKTPLHELMSLMNKFPGLQRRMEKIKTNLYSDYAHTPDKIRGAMSVASEMAADNNQDVVVVYEPLTNRRQHYMIDDYKDCFDGAAKVYWIPSYLAREDPEQRVIEPEEMISHLNNPSVAEAHKRDERLKQIIEKHLAANDMVICLAGGGGNSLDDWVRDNF